jgi:hypothetical protein
MNAHFTSGAVSLVLLILYLVIKDITIPLLRRRQNSDHSSNNPSGSSGELKAVTAKYDAQWDEQRRVNDRVDKNITRIFERLDEDRK